MPSETPAGCEEPQDNVEGMALEFSLFLGSLEVWLSSYWFSNMFSSEQGEGLEKIHNVGLINSKTPSQIGSFQGQQVTVTLSLSTKGANVRGNCSGQQTNVWLLSRESEGISPLLLLTSFISRALSHTTHDSAQHRLIGTSTSSHAVAGKGK